MLSSLAGLPPLPKSLSGLLNIPNSQSSSRESSPATTNQNSPYRSTRSSLPAGPSNLPQPGLAPAQGYFGSQGGYLAAPGLSGPGLGSSLTYANVVRPEHTQLRLKTEDRAGSQGAASMDTSLPSTNTKAQVQRKFSSLDSQLSFLRKEMELKLTQSRNSSLSPHDWLDQEGDSDVSDEYYSGADYASPEDSYAQPYNSNGIEGYSNGHGLNDPRLNLKPIPERRNRTGSNSSVEFGDI